MSTYLYKDYFGSPKHKHDWDNLLQVGIPITIVSSFGVIISVFAWIWVLLIWGGLMLVTWTTLYVLAQKFEKREAVFANNYSVREAAKNFLTQWEKLDMEMRRELVDLYSGVYQFAKTSNEAFGYHDSTQEVIEMAQAIDQRTKAVKSVVIEKTRLKVQLAKSGMVDLDSHAFETARLYAESYRQQAEELNSADD